MASEDVASEDDTSEGRAASTAGGGIDTGMPIAPLRRVPEARPRWAARLTDKEAPEVTGQRTDGLDVIAAHRDSCLVP